MPNTQLTHEGLLSLYERQTTFISDVVHQKSGCLDIFDDEERQVFEKYFLPDWSLKGDFMHYHERLEQENPELITQANELLKKFLKENDLDASELLLPQ